MNKGQAVRMIELLEKNNELLEVLVAAEYANAQATEHLMRAFEGGSGNKTLDASLSQLSRMGGTHSDG